MTSPVEHAVSTDACWACGGAAFPSQEYPSLAVHRCSSCGLLFRAHFSSSAVREAHNETYFERYAGGGDYAGDVRQRRYEARARLKFVLRQVTEGRLLDIGCAAGFFLEAARRAGFEPLGVEPGERVAQQARERGADVVTGFVEDVDFPGDEFDVACAWHVLEHIPEPLRTLDRIAAALKPKGFLFVEVPNIESVQARRMKEAWEHFDPTVHVAHYTERALVAVLTRAGFDVVAAETFPVSGLYPPRRALRPRMLAHYARQIVDLHVFPRRPHPWKLELLRAAARRV